MIYYPTLTKEAIELVKTLYSYETDVINTASINEVEEIALEVYNLLLNRATPFYILHDGTKRNSDAIKKTMLNILRDETKRYEHLADCQVAVLLSINILAGIFDPEHKINNVNIQSK